MKPFQLELTWVVLLMVDNMLNVGRRKQAAAFVVTGTKHL